MATKTITLELDAYEKLKSAKRSDKESFSMVVRRAVWPETPMNGAAILAYLKARPTHLTEEELDMIEAADKSDAPPTSPWDEAES
jgi:predicted CopG family antitoxin